MQTHMPAPTNQSTLMTLAEAAKLVDVPLVTLQNAATAGRVNTSRDEQQRHLVTLAEVRSWIARRPGHKDVARLLVQAASASGAARLVGVPKETIEAWYADGTPPDQRKRLQEVLTRIRRDGARRSPERPVDIFGGPKPTLADFAEARTTDHLWSRDGDDPRPGRKKGPRRTPAAST